MVRPEGLTSNLDAALFETLSDWNEELKPFENELEGPEI